MSEQPVHPAPPPGSTRAFVDGWNCATGRNGGGRGCAQTDKKYPEWCRGYEAGVAAMGNVPEKTKAVWREAAKKAYEKLTARGTA